MPHPLPAKRRIANQTVNQAAKLQKPHSLNTISLYSPPQPTAPPSANLYKTLLRFPPKYKAQLLEILFLHIFLPIPPLFLPNNAVHVSQNTHIKPYLNRLQPFHIQSHNCPYPNSHLKMPFIIQSHNLPHAAASNHFPNTPFDIPPICSILCIETNATNSMHKKDG